MNRPIFVVSDLHLGDGGPRDNFCHMSGGNREHEFRQFLDHVQSENGDVIINGDLHELWQANISKVLTYRVDLLDSLAGMNARYLLGNHDIDLLHFRWEKGVQLTHPLFRCMGTSLVMEVAGRKILILHGHEQDPYCSGENPGIGRASAIYTGLKEDRNGGPLRGKYGSSTVESRTLGRLGWVARVVRKLKGEPSPAQVIRRNMVNLLHNDRYDAVLYGHSHTPGQLQSKNGLLPIYNSGCWCEELNSFVRINPDGAIGVWDWVEGRAVKNQTLLNAPF